jgi:hypothetical protein
VEWKSKNQPQVHNGPICPYCLGMPLLCLNPAIAVPKKSDSTCSNEAQSQYWPHTGPRRLPYAGSLKESSDATRSHRTRAGNRGIDVTAHQMLAKNAAHTTTYPLTRAGDAGSAGTRQVANSATVIYPLLTRFCRCSWVTSDTGQLNSAMIQDREDGHLPLSSTTTSCFSRFVSIFFSLSFQS